MTKPNGHTIRWLAILISVAFGVWGLAASQTGNLAAKVDTCQLDIHAVQVDSAAFKSKVDTKLERIACDITEIKAMLRAMNQ